MDNKADFVCPDCGGAGNKRRTLAGNAGVLLSPCNTCLGSGRHAAMNEPTPKQDKGMFVIALIAISLFLSLFAMCQKTERAPSPSVQRATEALKQYERQAQREKADKDIKKQSDQYTDEWVRTIEEQKRRGY